MINKHLEVELLDPDRLVKVNNLQPVSDPIFFKRDSIPTEFGLLSNEIFGNTVYERSNIFAYIDLGGYFLNPLIYKTLCKLNIKFKDIVHGTKYFKIINGDLVEDEEGDTGLDWLYENFNKIKFKPSASSKRDINIEFIKRNKNLVFMNKLIVIPPYYRDVNNVGGGKVSVGGVNKIYDLILLSVRALNETRDYGLDISNSVKGRLQDQIVGAYDFFTKGDDMTTGIVSESAGLAKKMGLVKRALQAKTTDYGSRLIISSSNIGYDTIDEMMVDLDYCGLPLASCMANLLPFMIFNVKRFFENEFAMSKYPYLTKDGKIEYVTVKDPNVTFSDDVIKHEIERFIKGYSNRFIPIEVPNEEGKKIYMRFKGRQKSVHDKDVDDDKTGIVNRRLTWCDIFYMAAIESAKGKHALLTRYPLNDYFGQVPNKINVLSTIKTEPIVIDGQLYKYYPYIREELISKDTSNKFIDTLQITNLYLKGLEGDYRKNNAVVVFSVFPIKY